MCVCVCVCVCVHSVEDLGLKALVKHLGLAQLRLEVGRTREDETRHVDLVVGDEQLHRSLRHLHVLLGTMAVLWCAWNGSERAFRTAAERVLGTNNGGFMSTYGPHASRVIVFSTPMMHPVRTWENR